MRKLIPIAAVLSMLVAGAASAHAQLVRAVPRVGAKVDVSVKQLRLLFSEPVILSFSKFELIGPGGGTIALGPPALDPKARGLVTVPVQERLSPGVYRVAWHVASVDTHKTEGDFTFTVTR